MTQPSQADRLPTSTPGASRHRWLLFIHQLPSQPSNLRVTTWRRLQQIGAIPLKQAVYALPDTPDAREDFEWLKSEVKAAGGDASVFVADSVDAWSDDALVEEFRRARQDTYDELARDVEQALKRASRGRRPKGTRAPALGRLLDIFRERLVAAERIDFFVSAGRDRVLTMLRQLEDRIAGPSRPSASEAESTLNGSRRFRGACGSRGLVLASIAWLLPGSFGASLTIRHDSASQPIESPSRVTACRSTCSASSSATKARAAPSKRCARDSASMDRRS